MINTHRKRFTIVIKKNYLKINCTFRFILEDGKLNLCMRCLIDFKQNQISSRKASHDAMVCLPVLEQVLFYVYNFDFYFCLLGGLRNGMRQVREKYRFNIEKCLAAYWGSPSTHLYRLIHSRMHIYFCILIFYIPSLITNIHYIHMYIHTYIQLHK